MRCIETFFFVHFVFNKSYLEVNKLYHTLICEVVP